MGKYTVKAGDTLSEILEKHGNGNTSVRALATHNNIRDPNVINVGQVIEIPGYEGESGSASGSGVAGSSANSGYQYKTPAYVAPKFDTSDETNKAYDDLNALTKPEDLDSSYEEAWKAAMDKINNREKFSYDLNGDALYQKYKDKYIQQGKMAMQDTMGQVAALTGGYGNSYAATAGNQAYQAHLNNLNDVIPELQQMAYDRYKQEGQDLLDQYSMAKDVYDTKYGEHRDDMSQYNTDRSYLQSVYDSLYGRDYTMWNDDRTFGYGRHRDAISDEQWAAAMDYQREQDAYQKDRDKVADDQWQKTYDLQKKNSTVIEDEKKYTPKVAPKVEDENTTAFTSGDWVAATAYLEQNGVSGSELSKSAMSRAEWQRHKNSYNSTGQGGAEVANYSTYNDYLAAIANYIVENK